MVRTLEAVSRATRRPPSSAANEFRLCLGGADRTTDTRGALLLTGSRGRGCTGGADDGGTGGLGWGRCCWKAARAAGLLLRISRCIVWLRGSSVCAGGEPCVAAGGDCCAGVHPGE